MTKLTQGNKALRDKDYQQAIAFYIEALMANPELLKTIVPNITMTQQKFTLSREENKGRQRVAVCGWALSDNAERVCTLAKLYETFTDVEVIGTLFSESGTQVSESICDMSVPVHSFVIDDEGLFLEQALGLVIKHPFDIVHLFKPKMPNIFFGILYKLIWNARVLVDIDGKEDSAISVDNYIEANGCLPELKDLDGKYWTCLALGLVDEFDGITVSNAALHKSFGGEIIYNKITESLLAELISFKTEQKVSQKIFSLLASFSVKTQNNLPLTLINNNISCLIKLKQHRILSLDFFDTLVKRKTLNPVDIFKIVAQRLKNKGMLPNYISNSRFSVIRVEAEKSARLRQEEKENNGEVKLEEIYNVLLLTLLIDIDPSILCDIELQVEKENIFINPFANELLIEARKNKLKRIIVSDTYFSSKNLINILNEKIDLKLISKIYVSSEFREGKYSNLFNIICKAEDTSPELILHVGDNYFSDVVRPIELKIKSIHLPYGTSYNWRIVSSELKYITNLSLTTLEDLENSTYHAYGYFQSVRSLVCSQLAPNEKYYRQHEIGSCVIGPLMYFYLNWVISETKKYENCIYIGLYREGSTIIDFLKIIEPELCVVKLAISRKIINIIYLADSINYDNILRIIPEREGIKLVDFCKYLSLDINLFPHKWSNIFLRKDSTYIKDIATFIISNKEISKQIHITALKMKEGLKQHFSEIIPNTNEKSKYILLDLGWGGSIQDGLVKNEIIALDNILGLYLSMNSGAFINNPEVKAGFIFDGTLTGTIEGYALNFVEILEQCMTPNCGSTVNYNKGVPVFGNNLIGDKQSTEILEIQKGAIKFIEIASKLKLAEGIDIGKTKLLAQAILIRFNIITDINEKKYFQNWLHDDNTNDTYENITPFYLKNCIDYFTPKQILEGDFGHYYWLFGLLKENHINEIMLYSKNISYNYPKIKVVMIVSDQYTKELAHSEFVEINHLKKFWNRLYFNTINNKIIITLKINIFNLHIESLIIFYEFQSKRIIKEIKSNTINISLSSSKTLEIHFDFDFDFITGVAILGSVLNTSKYNKNLLG